MAPPRRRRDDDSEEEEEGQPSHRQKKVSRKPQRQHTPASDQESDGESDANDRSGAAGRTTESRLANQLVRYALACEYSRTLIRRDAIREKVYAGERMAGFKAIFDLAQKQLRTMFGMQMIELPIKDRSLLTLDQKRRAMKSQNPTNPAKSSNTYILVSTLPPQYRTAKIIAPSKVQSSEGEAAYTGFYTILISIITLSGGEISDAMLRKFLSRLNADQTVPSLNPNNKNQPSEQTEAVLQRLIKQGYLVKVSTNEAAGPGDDGDEAVTWHVGPRGKVEVDNEAIAGVVRTVYGDASEGLEMKIQTSLKIKSREEEQPGNGADDAEGEGQDEEQGEQDAPARRRRRVNTQGEASPMPIRSRGSYGTGDPGPCSRSRRTVDDPDIGPSRRSGRSRN